MSERPTAAPDTAPIRNVVRDFLLDNLLLGHDAAQIDAMESFAAARAIDSTGFLELVFFVQERFGIKVGDDEIVPQNFDSLQKIETYVRRKLAP